MDPYPEYELVEEEYEVRQWPIRWLALIMLLAMLCGVISTPLAVFYVWYSNRASQEEVPIEPENVPVVEEQLEPAGRIAYVDLDGQLATIDPDGRNQRQLTEGEQRFRFPAWSPDGSQLAVLSGDSVFVISDQSEAALQSIYQDENEQPFYLYWSPDSRQVSFLANHPDSGIALHLAQGGDQPNSKLLLTGQPVYWDWLPGGQQFLFHAGLAEEEDQLALFDLAAGSAADNIAEPGFFQAPTISRNGRYWAYAELVEEDASQIVILDIVEDDRPVVEPHLGQVAMSWSPTDDLLAYSSPGMDAPAFYGPLRLLDVQSGQSQTLSQAMVVAFFWSPDGRSIAYFTVSEAEESGVQARAVRPAGKRQRQIHEIRLELWVVNVTQGSQRRILNFNPTDLFVFQFLPFFDQYARSHRLWSPDSNSLVIPAVVEGLPQILVVAADGSGPRPVANGTMAFWNQ